MLPLMLLPRGHRATPGERDGTAAPHQTSVSSGSAPACCHKHLCQSPCTCPAPGAPQAPLQGEKKALSVKPRKPKDVNAPLEPGDVSLFAKKTPGMGQGDLQCGLRLGEGQRLQ